MFLIESKTTQWPEHQSYNDHVPYTNMSLCRFHTETDQWTPASTQTGGPRYVSYPMIAPVK